MGIDLGGGFGAGGATFGLQQLLAQRTLQRQMQNAEQQRALDNAFREKQFASNEELKHEQLAGLMQNRQALEQDRQAGLANTLADQLPGGATLSPTDPAVGMLRTGGRGSLLQDKGIPTPEPPSGIAAPNAGPTPDMPGTVANSPTPMGRLLTKLPSEKQTEHAAEQSRKDEATQAGIDAKTQTLEQAAEHLRMQGEVNAANILRAKAEADAASARAESTRNKGNTINLSQQGKTAKSAIETAGPLTDQVIAMIKKEAPDIETNPQKYNTSMGKLKAIGQTLKYKAGFYDETDPRQQLVSLLQPIQAGQYTRSSRSRQMLELALKHMADPTQTLLTQYQRAKELKSIMPEMLEGIIRAEQPVDPNNPLGGSYFDPSKPTPMPSHAPTSGTPSAADLIKKYGG